MSGLSYEQENNILDQMSGRQMSHKLQTSDMNRMANKPIKTPLAKEVKPSLDKSSRKAFGNVSNVLRSGSQQPIGAKQKSKMSVKECEPSTSIESKPVVTQVVTNAETDPKFLDEIEDMHPIQADLMTDMSDSLTHGLFTIDEKISLNMTFDSDMSECLLPNKRAFNLNDFF